jgi:hypothetical protein
MRSLESGEVCGPNKALNRTNLPSLRYGSFSGELERYCDLLAKYAPLIT